MYKIVRRNNRVIIMFISPSGQVLLRRDISDMPVQEFKKYLMKEGK